MCVVYLSLNIDCSSIFPAVSMALADLHGFPGTIVHGDVHPVQWLRSSDGALKLNDFNNAEILDWDRKAHANCNADRGMWGGMVRDIIHWRS